VSDGELRRLAAELGVSVNYWDWQGREITVPDETLRAIVTALESAPSAAGSAGSACDPADGLAGGAARGYKKAKRGRECGAERAGSDLRIASKM